MSGILSKWVVLQEHAVAPSDLDDAGVVRADVVTAWLDAARTAYLDRCPSLAELGKNAEWNIRTVGPAPVSGSPDDVAVSATVAEVKPAAITLSSRIRTADRVADARSTIRLLDGGGNAIELGNEVRDELIALEHAAEHYN
jgi:acyl-CoA thioesterase FadM